MAFTGDEDSGKNDDPHTIAQEPEYQNGHCVHDSVSEEEKDSNEFRGNSSIYATDDYNLTKRESGYQNGNGVQNGGPQVGKANIESCENLVKCSTDNCVSIRREFEYQNGNGVQHGAPRTDKDNSELRENAATCSTGIISNGFHTRNIEVLSNGVGSLSLNSISSKEPVNVISGTKPVMETCCSTNSHSQSSTLANGVVKNVTPDNQKNGGVVNKCDKRLSLKKRSKSNSSKQSELSTINSHSLTVNNDCTRDAQEIVEGLPVHCNGVGKTQTDTLEQNANNTVCNDSQVDNKEEYVDVNLNEVDNNEEYVDVNLNEAACLAILNEELKDVTITEDLEENATTNNNSSHSAACMEIVHAEQKADDRPLKSRLPRNGIFHNGALHFNVPFAVANRWAVSDGTKSNEEDRSKSYIFQIPIEYVGRLIGKNGRIVKGIKTRTSADIFVKNNMESESHKICIVKGSEKQINDALCEIRDRFPPNDFPLLSLEEFDCLTVCELSPYLMSSLQFHLPEGSVFDFKCCDVTHAGLFFVQQATHPTFHLLCNLTEQMRILYSQNKSPVLQRMKKGFICAYKFGDCWHRGQIDEVFNDGICTIKSLDYGGYHFVHQSDLRQICGPFMDLPFQAIECYLAYVIPLAGEVEFSQEATDTLRNLTENVLLQGTVIAHADDGIPYVQLCRTTAEMQPDAKGSLIQVYTTIDISVELTYRGLVGFHNPSIPPPEPTVPETAE